MSYRYELRSTGRPFGPSEQLTGNDFTHLESQHTSLAAARKAEKQARKEMEAICGPNAWNDHFAIFALRDTRMTVHMHCNGRDHLTHVCDNYKDVQYTWPKNERDPGPTPDIYTCPDCSRRIEAEGRYFGIPDIEKE